MSPEYKQIIDKIKLSNNNKLLVCRFEKEELPVLDEMRNKGILAPALFCGNAAVSLSQRYLKGLV